MKLPRPRSMRCLAFIQLDIALAIVILGLIFIPLSVTSSAKLDLARRHHFKAVALNLIDGEIDVLLAGEIKKYKPGESLITPPGEAVGSLPKGEFILTLNDKIFKLEWVPEKSTKWGRVQREVNLK